MHKLTFCLPIRIDSIDRLNNLTTILDFYFKHVIAHYIILEADKTSSLSFLSSLQNVHYIYEKDTNPVFHRTKYINQMLKKAETPYAAVWDVDAVMPVEQVFKAYQLLVQDNSSVMSYPFDGKCWMINDYFSHAFRKEKDIKILLSPDIPKRLMCGYSSVGGAFLVNIEKYMECGGENEFFIGWGPEDAERFRRLEILGFRPLRVEGSFYHLNHRRGINSSSANEYVAYVTKKEFCKVCSMNKKDLLEYIQTWEWKVR